MDSFSSLSSSSSQSLSSMRHYHGSSARQRNFLGGEIDNLFKTRIPVPSALQQKKQSSLLNGDPVVSSLANLNAQLPSTSTPSVRMEQLIERQNRNLRTHLSQKNQNDYQKKETHNKQPAFGGLEQDKRQQFFFNTVSNQKGRFSQYKQSAREETTKALHEDQADSNHKLANKLHLLEKVFQKILNNSQIISFAKPEEIQQVRNILAFIQQASLRLSSSCEPEDQTSRDVYMEDLKTFVQRFGEPEEYENYFSDIALRSSQIESQQQQQQQQQQVQSSLVNPMSSNNTTAADNNPPISAFQQNPMTQAAGELIPEAEEQTNFAPRLSVLRKFIYATINWVNAFVKNPINIIRCLLLALSLLFLSAYFSAPALSHQPVKYVLDWLAYNKSSKSLIITGSLWYCCILYFGIRQLYVSVVGQLRSEQETHFWKLILNSNPILHISIIYMTDTSIIPQKFDLALWLCVYTTFSIARGFQTLSNTELRRLLTNIHEDYTNELAISSKLQRFSAIIFLLNMWFCAGGIWIFSRSGWQRLLLLFYEGIVLSLDSSKLIACATKLRGHMIFYVNANTEEVTDPLFTREAFFDSLEHIIQILHFVQLIANYFLRLDYQYILHLWLLYLVKKMSASFRHLRKNFIAYKRFCSVEANLDALFPRVSEAQLSSDDVCSICHDELLIARRIQTCGHKFHIKCLFKWLNSQQNSRCPICRTDIPNLNFDVLDKSQISLLARSIDGIMRGFIAIGSFFGARSREDIQREDPIQRGDPALVGLHPQVPNQLPEEEEETGGTRREQSVANNVSSHQDRMNQILRDSEVSQLLDKLTQHVNATTRNSFMQHQERQNQDEDIPNEEEDGDEDEEREEEKYQDDEKGQFGRQFQDHDEDDEEYQNGMLNQIQQWMGYSEDMNNQNNIPHTTEIAQQMQRKGDDLQLGQLKEEDIYLLKQFTEKLEREQTILMDLLLQRLEHTREELHAQPRNQLQQQVNSNQSQVDQDKDDAVEDENEEIQKINHSREENNISNQTQDQNLHDNQARCEQGQEPQIENIDDQLFKEEFQQVESKNIDSLDHEPSNIEKQESEDNINSRQRDKEGQSDELFELKSEQVEGGQTSLNNDSFF